MIKIQQKRRLFYLRVKVKFSCYRLSVAQRVGRGIALLFHDRDTRRGCVVSSTPRPHFIPGKDTVSILQEAGWVAGPVWTGGKSRPHQDSISDRPAHSQSLYRLSYTLPKDLCIFMIEFYSIILKKRKFQPNFYRKFLRVFGTLPWTETT